jgi:hypothetical protein
MAAISLSINRGVGGFKITDYTVGVLAPNANDVEVRFNTTDGQGNAMPRKDVLLALKAIEGALESGNVVTTPPGL